MKAFQDSQAEKIKQQNLLLGIQKENEDNEKALLSLRTELQ